MTSRIACVGLCSAALFASALIVRAQTPPVNTKFISARALYYTPTTAGLRSFHCNVDFDWKDFLTRYSGGDVKDDNPYLQFLRTIHLSVTDDLNGDGHLVWATTAVAPVGKEDAVTKMKQGMEQMLSGFFSSWNAYMNGSMVPVPDSDTSITEIPDGFKLHAASEGADVTELFDKKLLLTEAHVVQPANDVYAYPTFTDTPDGRVISAIRTVFRQPPTAPPAELNIRLSYAPVGGFRLPEMVYYELKNVGSFTYKFSGCTVQKTKEAPDDL